MSRTDSSGQIVPYAAQHPGLLTDHTPSVAQDTAKKLDQHFLAANRRRSSESSMLTSGSMMNVVLVSRSVVVYCHPAIGLDPSRELFMVMQGHRYCSTAAGLESNGPFSDTSAEMFLSMQ